MAKIKLNPVLEEMRGKVGDLVFKKYNQETVISRRTVPSGPLTLPQQTQRDRFQQAALYGKAVLMDQAKRAAYVTAGKRKGMPAFALMIADFFHAPTVDGVELAGYTGQLGESIAVRARDDFAVTGVTVAILDAGDAVLEQGAAVLQSDGRWQYVSTTAAGAQAVAVEVTAMDGPGNKTIRRVART